MRLLSNFKTLNLFPPLIVKPKMKTAAVKSVATIATGILISMTATTGRSAPIFSQHDQQVDALLAQMTPDEKIGQMVQVDSSALKNKADVRKYFLGSVLSGGSSDPAAGNTAQDWLNFVTEFQDRALQTRLKIPMLYGIDAVVGELPYSEMKGDRTNLNLSVEDLALIAKAKASGASVVTILFSGRPQVLNSALADSSAFVAAWLPGTEDLGVTDVLFGDCKFAGKLPRNWPGNNAHVTSIGKSEKQLFRFGYGLSH